MLGIIFIVFCVTVSTITGFFVFTRDPKRIVNRLYGTLTLALIFLSISNYLSLQTTNKLFYIRAVIFCSTIVVSTLYYLVRYIGGHRDPLNVWQRVGVYYSVIIALLDLTPFVFSGLRGGVNPVPIPNFAAPFFLIHMVVFLFCSSALLIKRVSITREIERLQYLYMMIGTLPILLFAPVTGFVMPIVLKNDSLIMLTPLYGAFFICLVGYGIVRHKLFDIQFFVVRASAYLTTLFLSAFLLVVPAGLATYHVLGVHPTMLQFIGTCFAGVSVLYMLLYLRSVFDRLTNRIFFRRYYDSQDVLGKLGEVLVHSTDMYSLKIHSAKVIEDALRPKSVVYALLRDEDSELSTFAKELSRTRNGLVIVTDELDSRKHALRKHMQSRSAAVAIKLRTTHEDLGYLVLGYKISGETYSRRDIGLLSAAASEIAISVQNALHFEEIKKFNETLQQRIVDATKKLSETNSRLKKLDETKDDFISMASHQLRTPLTSVKGYLSMVLEGDAGKISESQRKLLEQSFVSSQRMVYLISDLLNLSRLNTGRFIIEPTPIDLSEVIQEEVSQLAETAKSRDLALVYERPESFPLLMLDENKIHQVVMNFLDNAIYYTPSGGTVTVNLHETPTSVICTVKDTGIGVPRAVQHKLFSKFYRAQNAQQARPDGTGLGLFMAKKVVAAQGGSLIFESEEDKGSTFGFRFTKSHVHVPADHDSGEAKTKAKLASSEHTRIVK
jgi:signal transduction histidine kinase